MKNWFDGSPHVNGTPIVGIDDLGGLDDGDVGIEVAAVQGVDGFPMSGESTGRWSRLDRWRGDQQPKDWATTVSRAMRFMPFLL